MLKSYKGEPLLGIYRKLHGVCEQFNPEALKMNVSEIH